MLLGIVFLAMSGRSLAPSCAAPSGIKGVPPMFFLERASPAEADTIVIARLCLLPPKDGLGSYTMILSYDSTQMRARHVEFNGGGLQAANTDVPGSVRIAGASPAGFRTGALATIVFKPRRGRSLGHIRLTLSEANSPSGHSVLAGTNVAGYPASDRALGVVETRPGSTPIASVASATPRIDSVTPRSARLEDDGVIDVVIYGHGFAPTGNAVLFDAATVDGVASERAGTILRFSAPTYIPAHGSAQGRRVTPGRYDIRVRTSGGTSNAAVLTLRDGDR